MKNLITISTIILVTYAALFAQNAFLIDSAVCSIWSFSIHPTWNLSSKIIYSYDANGNLINWFDLRRSGAAWNNSRMKTYTYDSNGNQISELNQAWDGTAWRNDEQHIYTYDALGNQINELFQTWDGTWENEHKEYFIYDSSGNQIRWHSQRWDTTWVDTWEYLYSYDINGNRINELQRIWDYWETAEWDTIFQVTATYDSSEKKIHSLVQSWFGAWHDMNQAFYTYDINGNQTVELSQRIDNANWVNSGQAIYTYDVNGNLIDNLIQEWDSTGWINSREETYSYDSYGNQTTYLNQNFHVTGWRNVKFCDYFYSPTDTGSCSAHFNLYADTIPHNYYAVNMISGIAPLSYLWNWGDSNYDSIPYPSHTYDTAGLYTICLTITDSTGCGDVYCHSFNLLRTTNTMISVNVIPGTVGINDNYDNVASITISPNPAFDKLRINLSIIDLSAEIKIFNLIGELTSTYRGFGQQTDLDISKLATGIYILELNTGNKILWQKFVKGQL